MVRTALDPDTVDKVVADVFVIEIELAVGEVEPVNLRESVPATLDGPRTMTSSLEVGTPLGDQLPAESQTPLVKPVQVDVMAIASGLAKRARVMEERRKDGRNLGFMDLMNDGFWNDKIALGKGKGGFE